MSRVYRIIEGFFREDPPEAIRKRFVQWFFSSAGQERKEETLRSLWDHLRLTADASTEQSFREVERRLGFPACKKTRFSLPQWSRVAAILLIPLLSLGMSWVYVHNRPAEEPVWVECFVPDGETRHILLPDHSEVKVNSGSTLFYPAAFKGKIRTIYLSGEAKFTVSPDKKKPFIVKTNDLSVEALGTVFNISSYPAGEKTTASLSEGKIKVEIPSTRKSFILSPQEQIVYDRKTGQSERKRVRMDYVLAWEKGQMVFQGASLYSVVNEIERHYKVKVYLNSKDLSDEKLTVKFVHNETLEEVLYTLQQIVAGFKYKIDGDKVYIHK